MPYIRAEEKVRRVKDNRGFTLIEVIVSIALMGIISIGMLTALSAEFKLLKNTQTFTEDVSSAQQNIEEGISDVKKAVQDETSTETGHSYTIFGGTAYARTVNGFPREIDIRVGGDSRTLYTIIADNRMPEFLTASATVEIDFSNDSKNYKDNPSLSARSDVNIDDPNGVNLTNIYRWYVSRAGFNIPELTDENPAEVEIGTKYPRFPDDYSVIPGTSATTLASLSDRYPGRHVICTVTPASQSGKMGATAVSNALFVGGLPVKDNLRLHLDASMISRESSTAVRTDAGQYYVKNWADISGNGSVSAAQSTSNRQPELVEAYIGDMVDDGNWYETHAKYAYFDGSNDVLTANIGSLYGDSTIFVAAKTDADEYFTIYQDDEVPWFVTVGTNGNVVIGGNTGIRAQVAEVIVYDEDLAPGEAESVRKYLTDKYRPETPPVTIVSLQAQTATVYTGDSFSLPATVPAYMSNGRIKNVAVTWFPTTLDTGTAGTKYSVATAVENPGKTTTFTLNVIDPTPVTGVTLNKHSTSMEKDGSETLTATVSPENATNQAVTWSSSNPSIAAVDQSGNVTGAGIGRARITVTTVDGGFQDFCDVEVTAVSVTGVSLNKSTITLKKNSSGTLTATVSPPNATNKTVTWTSSDTSIVTVSSSGALNSKNKTGIATVTVRTADGGYTASCTVYVVNTQVSGVSLNKHSIPSLEVGKSETLTATVTPSTATYKTVTWSSSDTSVATVSASGTVTGVAPGTAVITVTTDEGGFTDTCSVTVFVTRVTGVTLNKSSMTLPRNGSGTLTATVAPSGATDKTVTWESSNPAIVTVDQNGTVRSSTTAGSATITVRTQDGGFTAMCSVTVDVTPPTVTTLGNGLSDYSIPKNSSVDLVFSEPLSEASKTAVQNALSDGCSRSLTFSWSGSTLTIRRNGNQAGTFASDVRVDITDLAGNTTSDALLINSK